jgi:hypothetical protein
MAKQLMAARKQPVKCVGIIENHLSFVIEGGGSRKNKTTR